MNVYIYLYWLSTHCLNCEVRFFQPQISTCPSFLGHPVKTGARIEERFANLDSPVNLE